MGTYTPLLSDTSFDGVTADVNLAIAGIITIAFSILAAGLLLRVLSR
jgi:hypothetical protein